MHKIIIFIFFLLGLYSCQTKKTEKADDKAIKIEIPSRTKFPLGKSSILSDSLASRSQIFTIRGDQDTILIGKSGTLVTISRYTFVNESGEIEKGNIIIELLEAIKNEDIILSHLQSVSHQDILSSAGMIFIDAKANNKTLLIKEGKKISIDLNSDNVQTGMKIFNGEYNASGNIKWKEDGKINNYLIPVPLEYLDFKICWFECGMCDHHIQRFKASKNENTYIATNEFLKRACILNSTCAGMYLTTPGACAVDEKLFNIYLHNTDKNLFEADSMAYHYLYKKYKTDLDSNYKFNWDEKSWRNYWVNALKDLYNERSTKVRPVKDYGIDLNGKEVLSELTKKGLSEEEAADLISYNKRRNALIQNKKDETATKNLTTYSFEVSKLGWINVDRFFNHPDAAEIDLTAHLSSNDSIDYAIVQLIFPRWKVFINGHNESYDYFNEKRLAEKYSFTEDGLYSKLPVGEEAYLVAISYKNNKPYFGIKKIKIEKSKTEKIEMKVSSFEEIKKRIKELN